MSNATDAPAITDTERLDWVIKAYDLKFLTREVIDAVMVKIGVIRVVEKAA